MKAADGFGTGVPPTDPGVVELAASEVAAAVRCVNRRVRDAADRALVFAALGLSETADTQGGVR